MHCFVSQVQEAAGCDGDWLSFHCGVLKTMALGSIDPSLALGFYCRGLGELPPAGAADWGWWGGCCWLQLAGTGVGSCCRPGVLARLCCLGACMPLLPGDGVRCLLM